MAVSFVETEIDGVLICELDVFQDGRGFFAETFHIEKYAEAGIRKRFVQDNFSRSVKSTLRGLHYQLDHPQEKLVTAVSGEIFDVAVDIRRGSPTFGKWVGTILSDENHRQLFVPAGFAHGFCVLSESADVVYKCTDIYGCDDDRGVRWSDPLLGINWPISQPRLSGKDSALPLIDDLPESQLPEYRGKAET